MYLGWTPPLWGVHALGPEIGNHRYLFSTSSLSHTQALLLWQRPLNLLCWLRDLIASLYSTARGERYFTLPLLVDTYVVSSLSLPGTSLYGVVCAEGLCQAVLAVLRGLVSESLISTELTELPPCPLCHHLAEAGAWLPGWGYTSLLLPDQNSRSSLPCPLRSFHITALIGKDTRSTCN